MKNINHIKQDHLCKDKVDNINRMIKKIIKFKIILVCLVIKLILPVVLPILPDYKIYYLIQKFQVNTVYIFLKPILLKHYQHQIWDKYLIYNHIWQNIVNSDKDILTIHMKRQQKQLINLHQMDLIYQKHKKKI